MPAMKRLKTKIKLGVKTKKPPRFVWEAKISMIKLYSLRFDTSRFTG